MQDDAGKTSKIDPNVRRHMVQDVNNIVHPSVLLIEEDTVGDRRADADFCR